MGRNGLKSSILLLGLALIAWPSLVSAQTPPNVPAVVDCDQSTRCDPRTLQNCEQPRQYPEVALYAPRQCIIYCDGSPAQFNGSDRVYDEDVSFQCFNPIRECAWSGPPATGSYQPVVTVRGIDPRTGERYACDTDNNLCNGGACDATGECQDPGAFDNTGQACETDNNFCTVGICNRARGCDDGAAGQRRDCDDGNGCTVDSCDRAIVNQDPPNGACVSTPVAYGTPGCARCGDGVVQASEGEACDNGAANGDGNRCRANCQLNPCFTDLNQPVNVDDANPCTADSCNPATGIVNTPLANGSSCADGDLCDGAETCQAGVCSNGTPLACNDNNPCTDDSCNPAAGCVFTNDNANSCADGNACNGAETCQAGACAPGTPLNADDGNPCTVDSCDPALGVRNMPGNAGTTCRASTGVCDPAETCSGESAACPANRFQPSGTSCTDGDACNGAETCNAAGACAAGTPLNCEDGNPCTNDSCNAATGCANPPVPNGTSCADGDLCDGTETCQAGSCSAGTPVVTNDNNACTADSCDPATGQAVNQPIAGCCNLDQECQDGNICTTDRCTANRCTQTPIGTGQPNACDGGCNALICNPGDACNNDGAEGCCTCSFQVVTCDTADDNGNSVPDCRDACGNGAPDAGEECDDGNATETDACLRTCVAARCGDGIVRAGVEQCDDANATNNDLCTNACQNPRCGDGIVQGSMDELCDDGNAVDNDACRNSCRPAVCGDGVVRAGVEQCDDGNAVDTDACRNTCVLPTCGDGIVQAGEQCDDGNNSNTDVCTNACQFGRCGDGFVQPGREEQCDDGNSNNSDACLNTCQNPRCGDGFTRAGVEACDDGNAVNTDACLTTCALPACGDGFTRAGVEACDDGNPNNNDACTVRCAPPTCGDGLVLAGTEACDDGNEDNTDACLTSCQPASCGDGFVRPGVEECDDRNSIDTDACTNACQNARCGDGLVRESVEQCDPPGSQTEGGPICGPACQQCLPEACGDFIDNDCDGQVDDGCGDIPLCDGVDDNGDGLPDGCLTTSQSCLANGGRVEAMPKISIRDVLESRNQAINLNDGQYVLENGVITGRCVQAKASVQFGGGTIFGAVGVAELIFGLGAGLATLIRRRRSNLL